MAVRPELHGPAEASPRFAAIDRAKAIGIVLVVLGHAPGLPEPLGNLIYGFHMPLFFFLSGFLLSRRRLDSGFGSYVVRLLRSLGLPYLGFFALSWGYWLATRNLGARAAKFAGMAWSDPLAGLASGIGGEIVVNVTLWFFPCLMTTALLYYLARKVLGALAALGLFGGLGLLDVLCVDYLPGRLPWGLDNAWTALAFYALGQWLRGRPLPAWTPERRGLLLTAGGSFVLLTLALSQITGRVDLNSADFGAQPLLYFPMALSGIAAVLAVAKVLPDGALIRWLAANTLLIFPSHPIVVNFLSGLGKLVFGMPEGFATTPAFGLGASVMAVAVCAPFAGLLRRPGGSGRMDGRAAA